MKHFFFIFSKNREALCVCVSQFLACSTFSIFFSIEKVLLDKNREALCVSCFSIPDVKHFFLHFFSMEKVLHAKNREALCVSCFSIPNVIPDHIFFYRKSASR